MEMTINHECIAKKNKFTYTAIRHCLGVQMHPNLILANCISCKPKTEKCFSMRTLTFLQSSHPIWNVSPQKEKEQKEIAVEGATECTLFDAHVGFGFGTGVLPTSPELVQNYVRKNRENLPLTCVIRPIWDWHHSHTFVVHFWCSAHYWGEKLCRSLSYSLTFRIWHWLGTDLLRVSQFMPEDREQPAARAVSWEAGI